MQPAISPAKATLSNVDTGEEVVVLCNPAEVVEAVAVNYSRQGVPGLSHQPLQYTGTGNRTVSSLAFWLDRRVAEDDGGGFNVDDFRRFLLSLTVPSVQGGESKGRPPRVLLVLPKLLTIEAVLASVEFRFSLFAEDGRPLLYVATCSFEEFLDARRSSEDLRGGG